MSTHRSTREHSRRGTAARLLATLGISLLATGLVVLGASSTATANDTAKPGAPGNNGTVKVGDQTDIDEQKPENDPHLPCTFNIQWFNFDSGHGQITSHVSFDLQAPTNAQTGVTMKLVSGNTAPTFVGNGGQPGAGNGRDHIEWYTLSFTGPAQPQQGYHVKITVETPHSRGNDLKHKVFWVGPCEAVTTSPSNPVTSPSNPVTSPSQPVTTASNPTPSSPASPPASPGGSSAAAGPSQGGVVAGTDSAKPKPKPDAQPTKAAPPQVLGTHAVAPAPPTAVAAGQSGTPAAGLSAGAWAAAMIGMGLALSAAAAVLVFRGSRGSHQA